MSDSETRKVDEEKKKERMKRLQKLHLRQNEARKLNHREVVEEDRKAKLPPNWEKKKERIEEEEELERKKRTAEEQGLSYDRLKVLEWGAEECDAWDRRKVKRTNPDTGFANFEASTARTYDRLTKEIVPDMDNYEQQKADLGDDFFATTSTVSYGTHKPTTQAVDKMVIDLEKQIEKRKGYSRRRMERNDADVDYINERNKRFNKKIDRFYGQYTTEIKQNLERGTAV